MAKPAKNNNLMASEFLPKYFARITSKAIREARTIVAEAPVIIAKRMMEIDPTRAENFLPKIAKRIIMN